MLSAVRTGEEYFALRMASQAAVKVFGNPQSRPHLPWSNGHTQVESAGAAKSYGLNAENYFDKQQLSTGSTLG
jgi:hypothetical protein